MTYQHHLNLGDLIDVFEQTDPDREVLVEGPDGLTSPDGVDSYRGDYRHLMLEYGGREPLKAGELLQRLKHADGGAFEGYKGGTYFMGRETPVFIDRYGGAQQVAVAGVEAPDGRIVIRGFQLGHYW